MRTSSIGLAAAALLAALAAPAFAQGRVALIIGNAAYKEQPLANPVNDARLMADTLRRLGFTVIARENADKKMMETAILEFGERVRGTGSGAALFYYAGHGMQVKGRNFLMPVDAQPATEASIRVEAVDVDLVLEQMGEARDQANIVILDACRNNPFERRMRGAGRGLAAIDAARGTLIAYATSPGSVASDGTGGNGLYTEELVKALSAPGLKVEEVFKQVRIAVADRSGGAQTPWESSSLVGDLVFNASGPATASAPTPPAAHPPPASDIGQAELAFWNAIKDSPNPAEFRAYLEAYPNGRFAPLARVRSVALAPAAPAAPSAPPPPTRPPPSAASSPPAVASLPPPTARPGGPATAILPCRGRLADYPRNTGTVTCGCSGGETGTVWGTDVYTDDSAICAAGRHAGLITPAGIVSLTAAPGQPSYRGSSRNGIDSSSYGAWSRSYTFGTAPRVTGPTDCPDTGKSLRNYDRPIICVCSAEASAGGGTVWGSDVYTDDSAVCKAARHAGAIGGGGIVTLRWTRGHQAYSGSARNGVSTNSYGAWGGSLVFER